MGRVPLGMAGIAAGMLLAPSVAPAETARTPILEFRTLLSPAAVPQLRVGRSETGVDRPPVLTLGDPTDAHLAAAGSLPVPGTGPLTPPWALVEDVSVVIRGGDMTRARERALRLVMDRAAAATGMAPEGAEARLRWIEAGREAIGPDEYHLTATVALEAEPYLPPPDPRTGWDLIVPVTVRAGSVLPFEAAWHAAWRRPGGTSHDLAAADGDEEDRALLDRYEPLSPDALAMLRDKYGADHAWYALLWEEPGQATRVEFQPLDPAVLPGWQEICDADRHGAGVRAAYALGVGTPPPVHPDRGATASDGACAMEPEIALSN